jgi:hypothetical protein
MALSGLLSGDPPTDTRATGTCELGDRDIVESLVAIKRFLC